MDDFYTKRLKEMIVLRDQKVKMTEIAKKYGISRERVRQILSKVGNPNLLGFSLFQIKLLIQCENRQHSDLFKFIVMSKFNRNDL